MSAVSSSGSQRVRAAEVLCLDVNETLADLRHLESRLSAVGAPPGTLPLWFSRTLRDGMAATLTGAYVPFRAAAADALRETVGRNLDDDVLDGVLAGFPRLPLHPDVVPGLRALRSTGRRLVALTNGSAEVTRSILAAGGLADVVETVLSVDDVGRWKPHPEVYAHASRALGVPAASLAMVAAHPWDLAGAAVSGMATVFVDRSREASREVAWPSAFPAPDLVVRDVTELAATLA